MFNSIHETETSGMLEGGVVQDTCYLYIWAQNIDIWPQNIDEWPQNVVTWPQKIDIWAQNIDI